MISFLLSSTPCNDSTLHHITSHHNGSCKGNVLYFREGTLLVEICGKEPRRWTRHCEVISFGLSVVNIPSLLCPLTDLVLTWLCNYLINMWIGLSSFVEPVSRFSSYCTICWSSWRTTTNLRIDTVRDWSYYQHCRWLSTAKTVDADERNWMKNESF